MPITHLLGRLFARVRSVDRIRWTFGGAVLAFLLGNIALFTAFLIAVGALQLVAWIRTLFNLAEGLIAIPGIGWGIAAAVIALLILVVMIIAPIEVGRRLSQTLGDSLDSEETLESLADAGLFLYAGEGLAESLSLAVIQKAVDDDILPADATAENIDLPGRSRFRQQFWQMVHVRTGLCQFLIRTN